GKALKQPAGGYSYWKRMASRFVRVDVVVYLLEVSEEMADWREAVNRQRAWLPAADAALLIDEPELSTLLRDLTALATDPA
ncbi:MAG: NUDIX hydrolase, partial [Mesorhizobium sp.]